MVSLGMLSDTWDILHSKKWILGDHIPLLLAPELPPGFHQSPEVEWLEKDISMKLLMAVAVSIGLWWWTTFILINLICSNCDSPCFCKEEKLLHCGRSVSTSISSSSRGIRPIISRGPLQPQLFYASVLRQYFWGPYFLEWCIKSDFICMSLSGMFKLYIQWSHEHPWGQACVFYVF